MVRTSSVDELLAQRRTHARKAIGLEDRMLREGRALSRDEDRQHKHELRCMAEIDEQIERARHAQLLDSLADVQSAVEALPCP